MNRFKLLIIFLFLLIFQFSPCLYSQVRSNPAQATTPYPPRTELVEEKGRSEKEVFFSKRRKFRSKLTPDEIVNFYRNLFTSRGFKERKDMSKKDNIFIFAKSSLETAALVIYDYKETEGITLYFLKESESKYVMPFINATFTKPKRLDFLPIYPKAKQYALDESNPRKKGVTYLALGQSDEAIDFYLKEMPKLGWRLIKNEPYRGSHNIGDLATRGISLPKDLPMNPKTSFSGVDVNVDGANLIFKQEGRVGDKSCVVNIIRFNDPPGVLKQRRIANPDILKKQGRVIISIYYTEN